MTTQEKRWEPTCDRFVAFLDILGFKDRIFRDTHENILNDFRLFINTVEHIEEHSPILLTNWKDSPYYNHAKIKPVTFSDSILLVTGDDSAISLIRLAIRTQQIVEKAISMRIPIKGAISFGNQTADVTNSLYFGKPLIYAYEIQDEILLYSVVLHHTTEQRIKQLSEYPINGLNELSLNSYFIKYKTPLKYGIVNHYLLKPSNPEDLVQQIKAFYSIVSGSKRCYVDNTLSFLDFINISTK
jgi:hypothetical protein